MLKFTVVYPCDGTLQSFENDVENDLSKIGKLMQKHYKQVLNHDSI